MDLERRQHSGSGNSATLNTTGASSGPIKVGATCTDSRGLNGLGFELGNG